MHKVTLPDGSRQTDPWLRWLRPTAYALMGVSGLLLWVSPVWDQLGITGVVMSGFLFFGGAFCTYGSVRERWVGEYVGIPLLASSFAVFSFLMAIPQFRVAPFIAVANFALLWSVTLTLVGRWREVHAVYRIAIHPRSKKGVRDAANS